VSALQEKFDRRWVCQVTRSGFHNGCGCRPSEPHGGWNCGWRWEASLPDNGHTRRLLGAAEVAP
jgi:hypothetical protein